MEYLVEENEYAKNAKIIDVKFELTEQEVLLIDSANSFDDAAELADSFEDEKFIRNVALCRLFFGNKIGSFKNRYMTKLDKTLDTLSEVFFNESLKLGWNDNVAKDILLEFYTHPHKFTNEKNFEPVLYNIEIIFPFSLKMCSVPNYAKNFSIKCDSLDYFQAFKIKDSDIPIYSNHQCKYVINTNQKSDIYVETITNNSYELSFNENVDIDVLFLHNFFPINLPEVLKSTKVKRFIFKNVNSVVNKLYWNNAYEIDISDINNDVLEISIQGIYGVKLPSNFEQLTKLEILKLYTIQFINNNSYLPKLPDSIEELELYDSFEISKNQFPKNLKSLGIRSYENYETYEELADEIDYIEIDTNLVESDF